MSHGSAVISTKHSLVLANPLKRNGSKKDLSGCDTEWGGSSRFSRPEIVQKRPPPLRAAVGVAPWQPRDPLALPARQESNLQPPRADDLRWSISLEALTQGPCE